MNKQDKETAKMCIALGGESEIWTTKGGRKIKVADMKTSHIINALNMLKRKGYVSPSTLHFYLNTPGPTGDMAQLAFEQECDEIFDAPVTGFIDSFEIELKNRGVEL